MYNVPIFLIQMSPFSPLHDSPVFPLVQFSHFPLPLHVCKQLPDIPYRPPSRLGFQITITPFPCDPSFNLYGPLSSVSRLYPIKRHTYLHTASWELRSVPGYYACSLRAPVSRDSRDFQDLPPYHP